MFALRKGVIFIFIENVLKAWSGAIRLALAKRVHCFIEISPILIQVLASVLKILVEFAIASKQFLCTDSRNDANIHDSINMESWLAIKIQMIYI